jgi:hypothetical protein
MPAKKQAQRESENKPKRVPVGGFHDLLHVEGKEPGYVYRWVLDKNEAGSRILKFKRGGWDFARIDDRGVEEGLVVGQENVYSSDQDGSIVRVPSGNADYSYLMRIKEEWYDEDQVAKQEKIDAVEDAIRRTGASDGEDFGQYGEVKISH